MKFCPLCGGDIGRYIAAEQGAPAVVPMIPPSTSGKYDQVSTWKRLVAEAASREGSPPSHAELVDRATRDIRPGHQKTIVHIAFDRDIVPTGGVLHKAALLEGRTEMGEKRLRQLGYAVDQEGHLVMVNDVPVGRAYQVVDYWGGEKQHKRWHLKYQVEINPSRNGNPFFMDENMIAFGAEWQDTQKMDDALFDLLSKFGAWEEGVVAIPLVLELVVQ